MLRTILVLPDPQSKFVDVMNKMPGNKEDLTTVGSWATYNYTTKVEGVEITLKIQWVENIVFVNEFARLYPKADAFVIAFSTANKSSFDRAIGKWMYELQYHVYNRPFYFCGTKTDERDSPACPEDQKVSNEAVMYALSTLHMSQYFQVSAEKRTGIKEMFDHIAEDILMGHRTRFDSDWRIYLQDHPYKPEESQAAQETIAKYTEKEDKIRAEKMDKFKNEDAQKLIEEIEEVKKRQKEQEKTEGKSGSCVLF
ncbi:hypothetical protein BLNAU_10310 [Blattamonas nauphoetae]|uniref:Uncharacterized protein n=1 Tax=Blattamonas nauphoetae TaxID=2049346 RepID=A0ABQ9XT49_9EUKA|nr:hypothetical protein BLNAU_10310 [Blattamonas nauphoetae]